MKTTLTSFKDLDWPEDFEYRSDSSRIPLEFYTSVIPISKSIDVILGYFSSNAIRVLALGFAQFIHDGGTMRFATNHVLSQTDKNLLLSDDLDLTEQLYIESKIDDLEGIYELLQGSVSHFYNCLKYLLDNGRLIIQPIMTASGALSHYKRILLTDGDNSIYASGSTNFTYKGIVENGENIEVSASWGSKVEQKKIENNRIDFDRIFAKTHPSYKYLSPDLIEGIIHQKGLDKTKEELLTDEYNLSQRLKKFPVSMSILEKQLEDFKVVLNQKLQEPKFPFSKPFPYQEEAYKNWVANNYNGIFAMATGTGKTVTALNCVLQEFKISGQYRFIVLVPTQSLANQWQREIVDKFNFRSVINSNIDTDWDKQLSRSLNGISIRNTGNFAFVTTYALFKRNKLQSLFVKYAKVMESVILIADEAHTLGSEGAVKKLPTVFKKKIALSATPERKYDDYGSSKLYEFFNSHPPKFTVRYSMKKAIEDGRLCQFYYYPRFVNLNDEELDQYRVFTDRLRPYIDPKSGTYKITQESKTLLILRKNIIHKAQNKIFKFKDIIEEIGHANFKNAFIYAPEGFEPNYWEQDSSIIDEDDNRIIDRFSSILAQAGLKVKNYLGETQGKDSILKRFEEGSYDALIAMKCLDEGIDVPRTEYAIFCASTGNPRQFIQRRGRVLRTHEDKRSAKIYDLIVSPRPEEIAYLDQTQRNAEINIFKSELMRVINFLALAENRMELINGEFGQKCTEFGIENLAELILKELEFYD